MDMHTAPRPTGRRKITPTQLHAELAAEARTARPPVTTPGRVLAAFKRAEPALGVPAQVVKLIDYLVGRTRDLDWDGTGLGPLAWPSDAELEDRLGVGRSQCKQIVHTALEGGYVRLRRSANGKRYGTRDKAGRITYAYGFDLSPLAERTDEFVAKTAEWEARRDEGRRLRREIGSLHGAVCSMVELAATEGAEGHDWPALKAQADALLRQRGRERDPLFLMPIAARMRALHVRVRELVAAATRVAVDDVNTGPTGPENRPHITTTNHPTIVKTITGSANALGQEEGSRRESRSGESGTGNALRGFLATPAFVLSIAPMFAAATGVPRPSWADLTRAGLQVCHELGVSKHAWGQACLMLGREPAVVALATIAARHARGLVQSPGGLLRRMVELHEAGTLRLDRTLFGLADELDKERAARAKAHARHEL